MRKITFLVLRFKYYTIGFKHMFRYNINKQLTFYETTLILTSQKIKKSLYNFAPLLSQGIVKQEAAQTRDQVSLRWCGGGGGGC